MTAASPVHALFLIAAFALGAIVGSFLNVVILRINTGRGLSGRSMCFSCGKKLTWRELVPIVSFAFQRGKCAGCSRRIAWHYPFVEMLTGIIFMLIASHLEPVFMALPGAFAIGFVYLAAIFSLLIALSGYDIRHTIVPDRLVYPFIALASLTAFFTLGQNGIIFAFTPNHLLAGLALATPFALLWLLSRGRLMGLGDAKLALGIGFLLGMSSGIAALMLAFWIGAVFALAVLLLKRAKFTMKSEIPFAPFLALGMAIAFFAHLDVASLSAFFTF